METRDHILDAAEALIQERGFSGFSFRDLSLAVGIRKASIHYYFPSKADLGQAVIARYRARMREAFAKLGEPGAIDFWQVLTAYVAPMMKFGRTDGLACLSGVLGGEFLALPEQMQSEIKAFFEEHETFLTELLERGRAAGSFHFPGSANDRARLIFSAVEGALLIKRIKGDASYFDRIIAGIAAQLKST
jgi:TetR/AcrR family transcriptional regulator, transcriptional repressor for nem operon